jgi:hypothetical protein
MIKFYSIYPQITLTRGGGAKLQSCVYSSLIVCVFQLVSICVLAGRDHHFVETGVEHVLPDVGGLFGAHPDTHDTASGAIQHHQKACARDHPNLQSQ